MNNDKTSVLKIEKGLKKYIIQLQGILQLKTGRRLTQGQTAALACIFCLSLSNMPIEKSLELDLRDLKEIMFYIADKYADKVNGYENIENDIIIKLSHKK